MKKLSPPNYYNIAGVKVNKPKKGIYVAKQLLNGGKTRSYKVCVIFSVILNK